MGGISGARFGFGGGTDSTVVVLDVVIVVVNDLVVVAVVALNDLVFSVAVSLWPGPAACQNGACTIELPLLIMKMTFKLLIIN